MNKTPEQEKEMIGKIQKAVDEETKKEGGDEDADKKEGEGEEDEKVVDEDDGEKEDDEDADENESEGEEDDEEKEVEDSGEKEVEDKDTDSKDAGAKKDEPADDTPAFLTMKFEQAVPEMVKMAKLKNGVKKGNCGCGKKRDIDRDYIKLLDEWSAHNNFPNVWDKKDYLDLGFNAAKTKMDEMAKALADHCKKATGWSRWYKQNQNGKYDALKRAWTAHA